VSSRKFPNPLRVATWYQSGLVPACSPRKIDQEIGRSACSPRKIEGRRRCGEGAGCIGGCDSGGVRCGGDLIGGSAARSRRRRRTRDNG
jgi:hypothetical protein